MSHQVPSGNDWYHIAIDSMVIQFVDLPIDSMVMFHINHHFPMVFPWFSHGFPMNNRNCPSFFANVYKVTGMVNTIPRLIISIISGQRNHVSSFIPHDGSTVLLEKCCASRIPSTYGYGSKLGTPKLWMVNTKLDIHICGPINGLPFWPTSIYTPLWLLALPSGKRLTSFNYGKIHLIFHGKTHYISMAISNNYVGMSENGVYPIL